MILLIISLLIAIFLLFKRYIPITNVPSKQLKELDLKNIQVIDLRDFNVSYKGPVNGAINIPIAYLNRHHHEIPKNVDIHVVALSSVEKNMGIRLLRRKGFHVIGFTVIDQNKMLVNENSLNYCK